MTYPEPSNLDDVLDSREVIERIGVLVDLVETEEADEDDVEELRVLRELASEGEGSPDWEHGETLIRDSYFEDYAQQLAEDIGAIDPEAGWPNAYIDWERAADALRMDYFSVDFDGETYWIRG